MFLVPQLSLYDTKKMITLSIPYDVGHMKEPSRGSGTIEGRLVFVPQLSCTTRRVQTDQIDDDLDHLRQAYPNLPF